MSKMLPTDRDDYRTETPAEGAPADGDAPSVSSSVHGWQPISTAPESEMVDLWAGTGLRSERIADCWLFEGEWRTCHRVFGDWEFGAGRLRGATPTHWMRRPAGPS